MLAKSILKAFIICSVDKEKLLSEYNIVVKIGGLNMAFIRASMGGGELTPTSIYKATVNSNSAGVSINVTNGKKYLVIFNDISSDDTEVTGCDVIFKSISNSCSWGGKYIYTRYLIVQATANTMSFDNSRNKAYDLTVTQLD